jgi:uncharacterized protein (TIGR02145 family)/uncharacterized repeat protein (TIGR02543 family)
MMVGDTISLQLHAFSPGDIDSIAVFFGDGSTQTIFISQLSTTNKMELGHSYAIPGVDSIYAVVFLKSGTRVNSDATIVIIKAFLQYHGNGNTGGTAPVDSSRYIRWINTTVKGNTGNLEKSGFVFAGWNTLADGSGIAYPPGSDFTIGLTNDLYAQWLQNPTYFVIYNGNGNTSGSVPVDSTVYESGASVTVKANTGNLVKTGYTFTGWNTAPNGSGTAYAAGVSFNIGNANGTLYAQWTQNPSFTLTYNANGSTSGSVPVDANAYEAGTSATVKANVGNLVKTGFTFVGWNRAANGSGKAYSAGDTLMFGCANDTLHAQWTQNPTYTLTYNGSGNTSGSVPVDANAYEAGFSASVKANSGNLLKAGFAFTGWNSAANGSGRAYATGDTLKFGNANDTLYAQWVRAFSVIYIGNGNIGGAVPTDTAKYQQGAAATVIGNTGNLIKTGFVFTGWNRTASGSGKTYAAGDTVLVGSSNDTLFAKWAAVFAVTYSGNGSTSGMIPADTVRYQQGTSATVLDNSGNLGRSGYAFAGWNSAANGSGKAYAAGDTLKIGGANIILHAEWTQVYSVTYNGNFSTSGTVPIDPGSYAQNASVTILGNTGNLQKTGYTFVGWNTAADGSGISYAALNHFAISANVTLYAKWVRYVTFNGQGATVAPNPLVATIVYPATTLSSLPTPPQKTSYVFDGWYTGANGTGTKISTSTYISANIEVYAKWVIKDIDGNIYTEITIGTQTWMVENFRATHLNDNLLIPYKPSGSEWMSYGSPLYCYPQNTTDADTIRRYGALYNWFTVQSAKLCPSGWHVPTDAEWDILQNYLIASGYNWDNTTTGNKIAKSMAAKTDWEGSSTLGTPGIDVAQNNRSGFSALPAGFFGGGGTFYTGQADWWTATESTPGSMAFLRVLFATNEALQGGYGTNETSFRSVRLVRD